jgi:uncharacterized membrane protein
MDLSPHNLNPRGSDDEPLIVHPSPVEDTRLGLPPSVLAGIACLVPVLGGLGLGIMERDQRFVVLYSVQSLLFWVAAGIFFWLTESLYNAEGILIVLAKVLLFLPFWLIGIVLAVLLLLMTVKAFNGVEWYLPGLRGFLQKLIAKVRAEPDEDDE